MTATSRKLRATVFAGLLALLTAAGCAAPGTSTTAKPPRPAQDPAQTCSQGRTLVDQVLSAGGTGGTGAGVAAQLRGLADATQNDVVQEQLTYAADAAQALAAATQVGDTGAATGARQVLAGFAHTCPVANGLFATGTAGWTGTTAGTQLATAGPGPAGGNALQVAGTAAGACGFRDATHPVTATLPGKYTLRLWVRAPAGSPTVTAQLSELTGTSVVGQGTVTVAAGANWQPVEVSLRAKAPGRSALSIDVSSTATAAGVCFDAADVSLTRG